jgi:hypothetical protein
MPAMTKPTSPAREFSRGHRLGREAPELSISDCARVDMAISGSCRRCAARRHDAHQHHHADVVVEPGVDDQRLQRRVGIAFGRRHALTIGLEHLGTPSPVLALTSASRRGVDADDLLDLVDARAGIGRRQVDLVDDRHDLEPLLERGVAVGDALRLDALRGVDHQQRALAGRQRADTS